jgi:hypothetical protein
MPTIYGYSNDDVDAYLFNGTIGTNPGAVGFDANIVKTYIGISDNRLSHRTYFKDQNWGGAARSSFRFQFSLTNDGNENFPTNAPIFLARNLADGRDLFRFLRSAGNSTQPHVPYYWDGAAWQAVGAGFVIPTAYCVITVEIVISATVGSFRVWVNGALVGERLGNTKPTASADIDCIDQYGIAQTQFSYQTRFAERLLTSADYMPYGLRDVNLAPDGAGSDATQDSGAYTDVNELVLNRSNGITLDTAGDHFTATFGNLVGAAATAPIMSLRLSADVRRGASGPANIKFYVKIAGTRYYSASIPVDGIGFVGLAYQFDVNPATTLPWTVTEINALEAGFEAA